MARPHKQGLDYFPLDVHMCSKIKFIKAKFKWEGFGVLISLFQHIYGNGYWASWSEDDAFLYADENRIKLDFLNDLVKECLKRKIFNQELFEGHQVLTSSGIQKRFYEVAKRRKNVLIVEDYVLIEELNNSFCKHNDDINPEAYGINVNNNPPSSVLPDSKSTQSKVKRKERESKAKLNETEREPFESEIPSARSVEENKIQYAFRDASENLGISYDEIIDCYRHCNDDGKFIEAVKFAIEKNQEQLLDNPIGFIRWAHDNGKTSKATRMKFRENSKPGRTPEQEQANADFLAVLEEDEQRQRQEV